MIVEREAQDITRGHHRAGERADVDLPLAEHAIPRIEVDGSDPLLHMMAVPCDESAPDHVRVAERFSVVGDRSEPATEFQADDDARSLPTRDRLLRARPGHAGERGEAVAHEHP
ncbi:MAG TPA: hypothetical protein VNA69_09925 [Thermoanaerobaculia bacterium]|nr:hypothetical protein [Thermoanaerobaculia bacterium]